MPRRRIESRFYSEIPTEHFTEEVSALMVAVLEKSSAEPGQPEVENFVQSMSQIQPLLFSGTPLPYHAVALVAYNSGIRAK